MESNKQKQEQEILKILHNSLVQLRDSLQNAVMSNFKDELYHIFIKKLMTESGSLLITKALDNMQIEMTKEMEKYACDTKEVCEKAFKEFRNNIFKIYSEL